jgi:hypoxanthine phosphoribosyltransferase
MGSVMVCVEGGGAYFARNYCKRLFMPFICKFKFKNLSKYD